MPCRRDSHFASRCVGTPPLVASVKFSATELHGLEPTTVAGMTVQLIASVLPEIVPETEADQVALMPGQYVVITPVTLPPGVA